MKKIAGLIMISLILTVFLVGCSVASSGEEAAQDKTMAEANEYYEMGRACLYGLDGTEIDLAKAYEHFQKAEELGKNEANFYLGTLYQWYNYPEHNYKMAKEYYEKCENNPYADINIGLLYLGGKGVDKDKEKAWQIFQNVIDQGCMDGYWGKAEIAYGEKNYEKAYEYMNKVSEEGTEQLYIALSMTGIGYMYASGDVVPQDYAKALEWYEKAAGLGESAAKYQIGYLYFSGNGVTQDYTKAMEWYKEAADLGAVGAMYEIGNLYFHGQGVEQDYAKALEWYEKAAACGNDDAMNNAGWIYLNVQGVTQDYAKALELFEKAAALGNADAMYNQACIYLYGWGVEINYEKALELYMGASALGNDNSRNLIGWMYDKGLGVEQDYAEALEWYEFAIATGDVSAMNNAGAIYAKGGYGVEQDYAKALELFEKAAALGSENAMKNAEVIRQRMQ